MKYMKEEIESHQPCAKANDIHIFPFFKPGGNVAVGECNTRKENGQTCHFYTYIVSNGNAWYGLPTNRKKRDGGIRVVQMQVASWLKGVLEYY